MDLPGRSTFYCGISVALAILGCNEPANDRPEILVEADAGGLAANDNALQTALARVAVDEEPSGTPPPISGGTLLVSRDGRTAVASDPDHDRVWVADLTGQSSPWSVALRAGDEPGRVIEDGHRRAHVILRGGGAVLTLDLSAEADGALSSGGLVAARGPLRRPVCAAPRGLAWNPVGDALHVTCAGGEIVTLPAAEGAITRRTFIARDLRDVVVSQGARYVTRFRSAEVLQLDAQDRVVRTALGARAENDDGGASVAWRALPLPSGGAMVLHQRATNQPLRLGPAGYTAALPCGAGVVQSALSVVRTGAESVTSLPLQGAVLGVDVALDPRGEEVAVAAPGGALRGTQVFRYRFDRLYSNVDHGCAQGDVMGSRGATDLPGQAIAVAYDGYGRLVVQTREPSAVHVLDTAYEGRRRGEVVATVRLGEDDVKHAGQLLFHTDTGAGVTCASCHPEGEDDGRVWRFAGVGARRTPTMRGGLLATAPFHWEGDARDLRQLTHQTFAQQMRGGALTPAQTEATVRWLDALPAIGRAAPQDPAAVARGRRVFLDPTAGCATCHSGARLTNNENRDVGTDGAFQVPSLIDVASRGPWLHDGRARTLREAVMAGAAHGGARRLDEVKTADLLAFLETL